MSGEPTVADLERIATAELVRIARAFPDGSQAREAGRDLQAIDRLVRAWRTQQQQ